MREAFQNAAGVIGDATFVSNELRLRNPWWNLARAKLT